MQCWKRCASSAWRGWLPAGRKTLCGPAMPAVSYNSLRTPIEWIPILDAYCTNRLIDDEIHNMRAAHASAIQHERQASLLITAYLASWYRQRGPYAEAIHLIDKILALPGASDPTIARARVLYEAGIIMLYKGEVAQARTMFEECLAISTYFGYDQGKADALTLLGRMALWWLQDSTAANRYLENALACYRELKSPSGVSWALFFLTKVALVRGDFVRAQELGEENLAIAQREGLGFTWPLNRLGEVAYANGDLGRARSLFEQSMTIERQSGESYISVETLTGLTSHDNSTEGFCCSPRVSRPDATAFQETWERAGPQSLWLLP